uniref:Eukaryotic translation initiation factor 3 subunit M n=1 Tax=Coccidioides posadasii RMSCC 3488 TaxID=454284 RepID=A0A0J6FLG8_COCPO|nr:eukaryotic translation initiation factor 3 subunit M [Coccidioides posadasii RMSCC 3488]
MAAPTNTLLIEGTFSELAEELAHYVDTIRKTQTEGSVHAEIAPALDKLREQEQSEEEPKPAQQQQILKERDEVLKKLVVASAALNAAPEKEITAAYNLVIHLVRQSSNPGMFLPRICAFLAKPFPSSPQHGPSIALSILSTIFNTLAPSDNSRYHVFLAILAVIRTTSSVMAFEALKTQLRNQLSSWIATWNLDEEDVEKLHLAVADAAKKAGDEEMSYNHVILALQAIPPSEASSNEARELAVRALISALTYPFVFDFTPLTSSDAIQNLRSAEPSLFELLEIFASDTLDAYEEFIKSTPLSSMHNLAESAEILQNKMRVLTLASLAASTPSRSLPYDSISNALRIPREDVEKWVIDTIRAGLVEGKLSQLKGEFLVHRATYRVFGERQWAEVQGRLMVWRRSLENVLGVIHSEKEKFVREGIAAANAAAESGREGGARGGAGERRRGGGGHQGPREVDLVGGD